MATQTDNIFGDYQPPSALEKVAGMFRKVGHAVGMVPFLGSVAFVPSGIAALLDTVNSLMTKGIGAGTTSLVSGTVDTVVTSTLGSSLWMPVGWVAGLAAGESLGEMARKGTNGLMSNFIPDNNSAAAAAREMQVLGASPVTTGMVPAGVGYAAPTETQLTTSAPRNAVTQSEAGPNQWTDMVAQQRGQTPEQAREDWMKANHEEMQALRSVNQSQTRLGAS